MHQLVERANWALLSHFSASKGINMLAIFAGAIAAFVANGYAHHFPCGHAKPIAGYRQLPKNLEQDRGGGIYTNKPGRPSPLVLPTQTPTT
jgi:hypothetical protein